MSIDDPEKPKPTDPPKPPLDYTAAGQPEPGKGTAVADETDDHSIEDFDPAQARDAIREAIRKTAGEGPGRDAEMAGDPASGDGSVSQVDVGERGERGAEVPGSDNPPGGEAQQDIANPPGTPKAAGGGDAPSTRDAQTVQPEDAKGSPADTTERVSEMEAKLAAVMQENAGLRAERAGGFARQEQLLARTDGQAEGTDTSQHNADAPGGSRDRDALGPERVRKAAQTAAGDQATPGGLGADAPASQSSEALRNPWRVGEPAEASTLRDRQDAVREETRTLGERAERRADQPGGSRHQDASLEGRESRPPQKDDEKLAEPPRRRWMEPANLHVAGETLEGAGAAAVLTGHGEKGALFTMVGIGMKLIAAGLERAEKGRKGKV